MMKSFVFVSVFFCLLVRAEAQVKVDFKLSPAGKFSGETKDVKGFATVNGDKVVADNVVVNLKSLNTGIGLRDDHMKNKYLNVNQYPEAILVHGEGQGGQGTGKLKLRGIEKEVKGTYTVKGQEVLAQFDVKLSDYGISGIKYMGVGVNDTAQVSVTIPVKKSEGNPAPAGTAKATSSQKK